MKSSGAKIGSHPEGSHPIRDAAKSENADQDVWIRFLTVLHVIYVALEIPLQSHTPKKLPACFKGREITSQHLICST